MRALLDHRTPRRFLYLLVIAFPLGLVEFIVLTTGFAVGLATAMFFGVPLLVALMLLWRRMARFERRLLRSMLGVELADPYRPLTAGSRLGRVRERLTDPATWQDLAYLLLQFPLATISFGLLAAAVWWALALFTAPLWVWWAGGSDVIVHADTALEGLALVPLGALLGLVALALARGFAEIHGHLARLLLTRSPDPELTSRVSALEDARARIIAAADNERRRLERDLHDGAQQRLVAVSLTLGIARRRVAKGEDASELLAQADADAKAAIGELRDLARGIHPAILTHRGLAAAIEDLAARAPVPVELGELPEGRLPEPVEAAAYFTVAESLTNVAKYARASYARVDAVAGNGMLRLEVADDGVGGASAEGGSGLRGLTDRVGALGGTLAISSPPGEGTVVRARVPLPARDAEPAAATALAAAEPPARPRLPAARRRRLVADHAVLFAIVMTVLVVIWLTTGAGAFWPQWVLVSWGSVLALHAALVGIDLRGAEWPRGVAAHAAGFFIAMVALTFVWAVTGAGYFWPQWPLIGWGALLAAHVWAGRVRGMGRG